MAKQCVHNEPRTTDTVPEEGRISGPTSTNGPERHDSLAHDAVPVGAGRSDTETASEETRKSGRLQRLAPKAQPVGARHSSRRRWPFGHRYCFRRRQDTRPTSAIGPKGHNSPAHDTVPVGAGRSDTETASEEDRKTGRLQRLAERHTRWRTTQFPEALAARTPKLLQKKTEIRADFNDWPQGTLVGARQFPKALAARTPKLLQMKTENRADFNEGEHHPLDNEQHNPGPHAASWGRLPVLNAWPRTARSVLGPTSTRTTRRNYRPTQPRTARSVLWAPACVDRLGPGPHAASWGPTSTRTTRRNYLHLLFNLIRKSIVCTLRRHFSATLSHPP